MTCIHTGDFGSSSFCVECDKDLASVIDSPIQYRGITDWLPTEEYPSLDQFYGTERSIDAKRLTYLIPSKTLKWRLSRIVSVLRSLFWRIWP